MTHVISSMSPCGSVAISFRRNDNDRRPPREVVTAKLLGDPRDDRLEIDAAVRRRVNARMIVMEPISVRLLLQALLDHPMGAKDVSERLSCSPSCASDRAKRARAMGYLEMREHRSAKGRLTTYCITQSGRDWLEGGE